MGKYADRYFKIDPWKIIEEDFNPEYALVSESIFSLGNEYMGLRGYFDEDYSGNRLQGSYVNGIFETRKIPKSGYRGMIDETEFMINSVDWTKVTIMCNDVKLDLHTVEFKQFRRELNLKNAILTRSYLWQVDASTEIRVSFERVLSMTQHHLAGQKIKIEAIRGNANVKIIASLDFSNPHESIGINLWKCSNQKMGENYLHISGMTQNTHQGLHATCIFSDTGKKIESLASNPKSVSLLFERELRENEHYHLERLVYLEKEDTPLSGLNNVERIKEINMTLKQLQGLTYDALLKENSIWWENQWQLSDIIIDGDVENQQGIRFCIFQLHQTLHTADHTAVIGAKGLTGEAYNGNTFWDTEVYCLPFYLFNNAKAARSILELRYQTLEAAKERAKALDLRGAFYPIATISGKECCDLWQHASLQLQASTGVMYGIFHYMKLTNDQAFMKEKGVEILIEICRMLASRGDFSPQTGKYGYYCVMGPDEFQMMVNNNTYTNFMAKKSFEYTLKVLKQLKDNDEAYYQKIKRQFDLLDKECEDWRYKCDHMEILYDPNTNLFEQHEGYFNLPLVKLADIPVEEFPLYSNWSYERIYRNSMLKQPDVLMFMLLFNSDFTNETLEANFDFYEPRCIHESSLSPSVHSILASQLGKNTLAYDFFGFATRMDLDNYNRNTGEGLHTTSIAGSWMNIVYGFGGLRSDGPQLALSPTIPTTWNSYQFKLQYQGATITINVTQKRIALQTDKGEVLIDIYGENTIVGNAVITIPLMRK
ncbi:glycoside hydrolase family 65 protein [Fusibacter bizertensis]